jgi:hypothetical protein
VNSASALHASQYVRLVCHILHNINAPGAAQLTITLIAALPPVMFPLLVNFCCSQDASVGTSLFGGYVAATGSTSNGVTSSAATTLDFCVTACALDPDCHFSEFRYNDQSSDYTPGCFLFAPLTTAGAGGSSDLAVYYKQPPTLDVSAASVQAASVRIAGLSTPRGATVTETSGSNSSSSRGVVRAQSVASGLYVKYSYAATVTLPFDSANLQTEWSMSAAAAACDMSAACWGFVEVSAGSYALKAGNDLVGARTVVNAMKSDEATGTASSRIVQP